MKTKLLIIFLFLFSNLHAQIDYFPPLTGDQWDTLSIAELGWCDDQLDELLTFLETNGTKAFLVLKDGKIVVERYFQGMEMNTPHQWNSAGKTITAMLVGIAQEDGLLSIEDKTSDYLGTGWTSLPPEKEDLITIRNQLTMTTGMDDTQFDCLDPACLTYLADAGTRWSYHNGPYTLLTNVIEEASGQSLNIFAALNLKQQTGIDGAFIDLGDLEVFFGSPRGMARMGLLMLNQGTWDNTVVLGDQEFFNAMTTTSQDINKAYGYLWWLNGSSSFMIPGSQFVFPSLLTPNAPNDLYSGLGKDGQFLDVLPSEGVVVIRMGEAPGGDFVPITFHNEMWEYLSAIICESSAVDDFKNVNHVSVFPNPFDEVLHIESDIEIKTTRLYNTVGQLILEQKNGNQISGKSLANGVYWLELESQNNQKTVRKIIKN
jgi:CubicO group peptidase (beta-lactamase class C family)